MKQHRLFLLIASVLPSLLMTAPAPAAPKLHYAFEPGRQYVYDVKIVATHPEAIETREGMAIFTVKTAGDEQFTLGYTGSLATRRQSLQGQPWAGRPDFLRHFPWADGVSARPGDFTVSAWGKVVKTDTPTALPYMLGDLEFLAIEEWPAEGKNSWEQKREVTITSRTRSRFPHGPFAPEPEPGVQRTAQEVVKFSVGRTAGDTVRLQRDYTLRSEEKADGNPRLELEGKGELVFDTKQGVLRSHMMKYTLRINETNLTLKVPVTVECSLLDPAEAAQRLKARDEAFAAARAAAAKAQEPKALEPGEQEKLLKELKNEDEWALRRATDRLARAPAAGAAGDIASALTPLLSHRSSSIRAGAAKALINWGNTNSAPSLMAAVGDEDLWVRKAAMEALGRMKTSAAAQSIAARLTRLSDRGDAAKALKAMGAVAEPVVLPHLKDRDPWVRLEACKILAEIGTAKSLPYLEEFGGTGHGFDKPESEKAIKTIKARP